MSTETRTFLRLLAVTAFLVGLVIVWISPDASGVDWRWFFTCIFAGNALFSLSFAGRP